MNRFALKFSQKVACRALNFFARSCQFIRTIYRLTPWLNLSAGQIPRLPSHIARTGLPLAQTAPTSGNVCVLRNTGVEAPDIRSEAGFPFNVSHTSTNAVKSIDYSCFKLPTELRKIAFTLVDDRRYFYNLFGNYARFIHLESSRYNQ